MTAVGRSKGHKIKLARYDLSGAKKDDDKKMMVLMDFETPEAIKAFGGREGFKAKPAAAGALFKTTVVTDMSHESFNQ